MTKFFKDLWAAPFGVKVSFAFLAFFLFVMFAAIPGQMFLTCMLIYSVFKMIDWLSSREDNDE